MEVIFPVYEFKLLPEDRVGEVRRYANGKWIFDDGEFDLAFATTDSMCYYVSLPYKKNILWSWAKDGNWRAYVDKHPDGNAWHYFLRDGKTECNESWDRDKHPNIIASNSGMGFVLSRQSCANGRGIDFHIGNKYILRGLVREKDTKKIVTFPEEFNCMYCGNLRTEMDERLKP